MISQLFFCPKSKQVTAVATRREVQSISDLHKLDNHKTKAAFEVKPKVVPRDLKESSSESSEPTDEEIVDIVQKTNNPVVQLRAKLSTSVQSDSNFNVVKPKRWSDYRASWNQVVNFNKPTNPLSKSEQALSPTLEESETPVPTTVLGNTNFQ